MIYWLTDTHIDLDYCPEHRQMVDDLKKETNERPATLD